MRNRASPPLARQGRFDMILRRRLPLTVAGNVRRRRLPSAEAFRTLRVAKSVMVGAVRILVGVAALWSTCQVASADGQFVRLAVSGDWMAAAHRPSITAPADICIVGNAVSKVALRADREGLQLRVANANWSLPVGVRGSITINLGEWKTILQIDGNTHTTVNADIPDDVVRPLFAAMDKAANMSVAVGEAGPISVSLSGGARATNAFRACAGIEGNSALPAGDPFQ